MVKTEFIHFVCFACALFAVGCGASTTSETASTPSSSVESQHSESRVETYKEAVDELVSLDKTMREAFANNDEDAAHGPLHDVGHLLEVVAKLSEKEGLTGEQQQSLKDAVDKLFDLYGTVDATMHGQEGKPYGEVSAEIDEHLAVLTSLAGPADSKGSNDEQSE